MRRTLVLGGALMLTLGGCDAVKDAFSGRVDTVARADGQTLRVDQLATWAGQGKQVPMQQEALYRLSRVWVDYTLFGQAIAAGRTLDDSATVALAMWPLLSQLKWEKLHDRFVANRQDFTPAQVDSAFAAGTHRLFQHILIRVPSSASPTVDAEKRRTIDDLRRQIAAQKGRNFTDLAVRQSEDPGSKERGGFLGISEFNDPFVTEFKTAAWALAPGELSPVVRTAFGYHIIRRPALADVRDIYRFGLAERIGARADSQLVDSLSAERHFELASGALALARQTVQDLEAARNSGKALVRYRGGTFRVKDLVRWIYSLDPQVAQAISTVTDEQLDRFLRVVAQRHMLIELADSAGVQPSPDEWNAAKMQHDSAVSLLRGVLNLSAAVVRDSAGTPEARNRLVTAHVDDYLERIVNGRAQFLPVPPFLSVALRERAKWNIDQAGVKLALERAQAMRGTPTDTTPLAPPSPLTPATGPAPVPGRTQ
jgi:hypothetical protein